MTAAQKTAKEKFKKAIEYRKKTSCTLKQAFAHVYGKKTVGSIKKKAAKKKAAPKKKTAPKKKATRNYGSHKDTGSHNVRVSVVSGIGKLDKDLIKKLDSVQKEIDHTETAIYNFNHWKKRLIAEKGSQFFNNAMKGAKRYLSELKKHKAELKKLI